MTTQRAGAIGLVAAGLLMGWGGQAAWAQDPIHKMGRGVVNVLTGWLELPKQFHMGTQEDNPVAGMGVGLLKGTGLTLRAMAAKGGEEAHVLTIPEMPAHTHTNRTNGAANSGAGAVFEDHWSGGPTPSSSTGGNQPHNTMPPFLVINYIIKL